VLSSEYVPFYTWQIIRLYRKGIQRDNCVVRSFVYEAAYANMAYSVLSACYHSVQNPLSSSLLSNKLQIKIYRIIILPLVVYECETWSLTLREERRLRVSENRV